MSELHLKPAPGLRVIDPATRQPLPADGATVQASTYWCRRLADGDVSEFTPDSAAFQTHAEDATKPNKRSTP